MMTVQRMGRSLYVESLLCLLRCAQSIQCYCNITVGFSRDYLTGFVSPCASSHQ